MPSLLTVSLIAAVVGAIALIAFGLHRWRRHGFRFSLRTSLVAITFASLAIAAFMQWAWPRLVHVRAVYKILAAGGDLEFAGHEASPGSDRWDSFPTLAWGGIDNISFSNDAEFSAAVPSLSALTQLDSICLGRNVTDASLRQVAETVPDIRLSVLQFLTSQITDVAPLARLDELPYLFINTASLTDDGLQALPEIPGLNTLFIIEEGQQANPARFGPEGFRAIAHVPQLASLTLANVEIASESAAHLHRLKGLRELKIHRCLIDAKDVAALREALPNCEITFNERAQSQP